MEKGGEGDGEKMSYIRSGSTFMFVEGESSDYIYPTTQDGKTLIMDYGLLHNNTLVELIARNLSKDKYGFEKYLIQHLAKRLKVKLRKKPLTREEAFDITCKKVEKFSKEIEKNARKKD